MSSESVLLLLASLGILHSLVFSTYLIFQGDNKSVANRFLALLLISIVLRVGKSLLLQFGILPNPAFINIGLAGFFAIGPSFYFYLTSYCGIAKHEWRKIILHYLPSITLIVLAGQIPHQTDQIWWQALYYLILLQLLSYLIISTIYFRRQININTQLTSKEKIWFASFIVGIYLVWLAYLINSFYLDPLSSPTYIIGAILYSFLTYSLTYLVLKRYVNMEAKYQNSKLDSETSERHLRQLVRLINDEKVFREQDLTLKKVSQLTNLPVNTLSQIINQHFNQNITDFINSYRIDESKRLLKESRHLYKIAYIANVSGFKSLSSFNSAFKKKTGQTPSSFRKSILLDQ